MSSIPQDASAKRSIRAEARRSAEGIDWVSVSDAVRAHLLGWLSTRAPTTVLVYFAMGHEASIAELSADARLAAFSWAAPRVGEGGELSIRALDGPLERHRFGFRQPGDRCTEVPACTVGIALVPGLAFDRVGGRLGHGKGHYDRLLPGLPAGSVVVGVTADCLVREQPLPWEPHDVRVGWLATESGIRAALPVGG